MTGKSVTIIEYNRAFDPLLETFARWLSCNGEMWGVGPTAVFASAALVFLYHELESSLNVPGDVPSVCCLERTLLLTMVLGMLALMTHLWVCSMRFLQCYLDTLIKDSPSILLEMTTVSLLGGHNDLIQLGPLTRFLRQQQPQIHMTICWFLALCYADFVRKNYCRSFNMPYLEQWQSDIHDRAMRGYRVAMDKLNEFICCVNTRLRGYTNATAGCTPRANGRCCTTSADTNDLPANGSTDALQKLRSYISETRCSCSGSAATPATPATPAALQPNPTSTVKQTNKQTDQ